MVKVMITEGPAKDNIPAGKPSHCASCNKVVSGDDWIFKFPLEISDPDFPPRVLDVFVCADCMIDTMYGKLALVDPKDQ